MINRFKNLKKGDTLVLCKNSTEVVAWARGKKVEVTTIYDSGEIGVRVIGHYGRGSVSPSQLRHPRGVEKVNI